MCQDNLRCSEVSSRRKRSPPAGGGGSHMATTVLQIQQIQVECSSGSWRYRFKGARGPWRKRSRWLRTEELRRCLADLGTWAAHAFTSTEKFWRELGDGGDCFYLLDRRSWERGVNFADPK